MFRRTTETAPLAGLALAVLLGALSAGSLGAAAQDAQKPQAAPQDDDHSYLPPWMRPQSSGGAGQPGAQTLYVNPADEARQKALVQQQQQQKQRRRRSFPFDFDW
jgi:hypothetical protein